MKKMLYALLMILAIIGLSSCAANANNNQGEGFINPNESSMAKEENPFYDVSKEPESYFSLDTSTTNYANIRRMINNGNPSISPNFVKIEEMINYFSYEYISPKDDKLSIGAQIIQTPWNENSQLLTIGVKTNDIDLTNKKPSNIVLLLDVSESMAAPNKLPLLQTALKLFVESLDDYDTISLVTYASNDKIVLDGAKGYQRNKIIEEIENLKAEGSTHGSKAIQTAYELAKKYFTPNGHNRVIIGTDGDFNVGISSLNSLKSFISEKRDEEKIYLSVLGFGYGDLKDDKLETLANSGNGTYAYIDSITAAKKVLIEEIGGNLNIVAQDAKAKVVFNQEYIKEYRLIGYENNRSSKSDSSENANIGEIGTGHQITAVYEIILNKSKTTKSIQEQKLLSVEIDFQDPTSLDLLKVSLDVNQDSILSVNNEDIEFISAVVEFGLIIRNSKYKENANLDNLIKRLESLNSVKTDYYKKEFLDLVKKYRSLTMETAH